MSRSDPADVREDGLVLYGGGDKAYQAYRMNLEGQDWDSIARTLGYKTGRSAQVEVREYITKAAVQMDMARREEVLDIEMRRLDALQAAVWPSAMDGDTKAVDSVLRVMGHRAKLLGLELVAQTQGAVTNNTVVVTGDTQEFIRSLRLVDGNVDDE
jgi:hypothetical protein